jgi:hypothetical protein
MRSILAIVAAMFTVLATPSAMAGVTYTYDTLGRLSVAAYDNHREIDYHYDPAGNRTQVVTQTTTPHRAVVQKASVKAKRSKHRQH